MKKLLLIILLVLSFNLVAQERIEFLDISFSCSNKEFQEQLIENGFYYTGNYYYVGEFMNYIRLVDFIPSCIEDEIYKLTLTYTHRDINSAIYDYDYLRKELILNNSYWDVSYNYCIIYVDGGYISLVRDCDKVVIEYIDRISENRIINQR